MITRYDKAIIGHSDHTPDLYTCYGAVALGAAIIEKHVIIDKLTKGPDQSVSIDFNDLKNLVDGVRKVKLAGGDKKEVHEKEKSIREWAFRSIVSLREIKKGETITQDMIWSKRPGTGIPSYKMGEVLGKKAARDIKNNVLVLPEDIQ
jgi:N-acetylneuraminate synthase